MSEYIKSLKSLPTAIDELIASDRGEAMVLAASVFRLFETYVTRYSSLIDHPEEIKEFCQTCSAMILLLGILGYNPQSFIDQTNSKTRAEFLTKLERVLNKRITSFS